MSKFENHEARIEAEGKKNVNCNKVNKDLTEAVKQLQSVLGAPKTQKKKVEQAEPEAAAKQFDLQSILQLASDAEELMKIIKNPVVKGVVKLFVSAVSNDDDEEGEEVKCHQEAIDDLKTDILTDVEEAFTALKDKIEERIAAFEDQLQ